MTGDVFEAVIVGGGPAGATAAADLARAGRSVLLLDRAGRIKPCGGAIPPRLVRDFGIPPELLVARIRSARMVAPSGRRVHMPIGDGYVGMVDREHFDEWLRNRAAREGAERRRGLFERFEKVEDGGVRLTYRAADPGGTRREVRARMVIGADGARSAVAQQAIRGAGRIPCVFAYHEIVRSPAAGTFDASRCDVHYRGGISPDFYGWVFPHGETTSVGVGSAVKGFSLRRAVEDLRSASGLGNAATIRCEGAPIPLRPLRRWDDGRNVVLAGDAAGCVAPASGEGIYYAMLGGRLAAEAVGRALDTGDARALATARRRFVRAHGHVFWILRAMQSLWYQSDERRERFVSICGDLDVQRLTWEAYMNKALGAAEPVAHARIALKNIAHLCRLVTP
jgi:geranylgeranyl diphosphate/geranylgeranyl-bacteriochlorophyllide a reductase